MDWIQIGKDFLSAFIVVLLKVLVPLAATALVSWVLKLWRELKAARPDVADALSLMMPLFVEAAEQAKIAGFIADKKDYALSLAQEWLKSRGWKLDLSLISGLIEQAVHEADFPSQTGK
jgi:hypothetical protein